MKKVEYEVTTADVNQLCEYFEINNISPAKSALQMLLLVIDMFRNSKYSKEIFLNTCSDVWDSREKRDE